MTKQGANHTRTAFTGVTLALPLFAAVVAYAAREKGVTLPFAVKIQNPNEAETHFAIVEESGRVVAIPCACQAEAVGIVTGRKGP